MKTMFSWGFLLTYKLSKQCFLIYLKHTKCFYFKGFQNVMFTNIFRIMYI